MMILFGQEFRVGLQIAYVDVAQIMRELQVKINLKEHQNQLMFIGIIYMLDFSKEPKR